MTTYGTASSEDSYTRPAWVYALLGIVMIAAGIFAIGDIVVATLISVKVIGFTAIVAGGFEIVHAFWTKGWGGFLWQLVLGVLYLAFGFALVTQPASGALILTYFLGLVLFVSGAVRCGVSFAHWQNNGWMMLLSGLFGMLAGMMILFGFPSSSLWVLGFLLGVDLISHGVAWLLYAFRSARAPA